MVVRRGGLAAMVRLRATALLLCVCVPGIRAETLTPPYFNLAEGRAITATATCGEKPYAPELYCKLVGANADNDANINVIQGQVCDECDETDPKKMHPASFAINGMETWWQSPPLSRGSTYNAVNLTIDFGQEFHVAYVFIKMGNSPRPGLWVLEKSSDYGKTFTPWQYFSDSPAECAREFGKETLQPITRDDSVICSTEYSKIVPLEGGEMPISLVNNRPSFNMYFNSTVLQEWTRATNVRLRLLRTKNLLGHLMSVARQDPSVTRRYFYSIKDISIGGRCMCNGHADTCDPDPKGTSTLICRCQHHTSGPQCATCKPGYEQKAWRQSTGMKRFICERCNCFNHATKCIYDAETDRQRLSLDIHGNYEGGGICQDCADNTEGINCNRCKPTFYRPFNKQWNETDVCRPCSCTQFFATGNCAEGSGRCECKPEFTPPNCDSCSFGYFGYPDCRPCECHMNGTRGSLCEATDGKCPCKANFNGTYCKSCANGYYNFPDCLPCECNKDGSVSSACDQETGTCSCKNNFGGRTCDQCEDAYYDYPECTYCKCDKRGTKPGVCDKSTGECLCKEGFAGERCDQCVPEYYGYPDCRPCNCSLVGSASSICSTTGKCTCLANFASRTCEVCSPGYYKYPECLPCNCHGKGSLGESCNDEGECQCNDRYNGNRCDACKEGFYNFPNCEDCNCHPAGVVTAFAGCGSVPAGELCRCKDRVQGRICDKCRPLYWNLSPNNPDGCEDCQCHIPGVMGAIGTCDSETGQCICKPSVTARGCTECENGSYKLEDDNLFGCTNCQCDIGGAINANCNKVTGQCVCYPRVEGRKCDQPIRTHYFPTLHHLQYEMEDGRTPEYTPVRYKHEEDVFPNYSWKGYAIYSSLQNEIIQDVMITNRKSSLYRMILRYVNTQNESYTGTIVITPDNPADNEQEFQVQFKPTQKPEFVTVSGPLGGIPSAFVMNPGQWFISITINHNVLLDYFVLLPSFYYEAPILTQQVENPCLIGNTGLCRHYGYPNISQFDSVHGNGGFISNGDERDNLQEFISNTAQLRELGEQNLPVINAHQQQIHFDLTVAKPGQYVLILTYITPIDDKRTHDLAIETSSEDEKEKGRVVLYTCPYTTICQQAVTDRRYRVAVFNFETNYISIILKGRDTTNVGIKSIVAIPYEEWSLNYIQPKSTCVRKGRVCVPASYPTVPHSKRVPFETGNEKQVAKLRPPLMHDNSTNLIYLDETNSFVDIRSKVPNPGHYVFVVHFYQPNYPTFELNTLIQNGQYYVGKLVIPHCPSHSGCRSIVTDSHGNSIFSLTENFVLTIKDPNHKSVWLDYVLVIPAEDYSESMLNENNFDQTREFITTCGQNHFHVNLTTQDFCRESVFSLTTAYNNGPLYCNCDYHGSLSFECEKFGGQCQCKPNIIGRKCEACKNGFYGFPDCKPCNCPSTAVCEPTKGKCICPPRVTGTNCEKCQPYTYGYDPINGCVECKCNSLGVERNNLQCDSITGLCQCKPDIIGRSCDRCAAGHYAFPHCTECECDTRGTTEDICDQQSAECFCKDNVYGQACDVCQDGSFFLDENNPDGCTKCFCFGKTTRCSSSDYYRYEISDMIDWKIVTVERDVENYVVNVRELESVLVSYNSSTVKADLTFREAQELVTYFAAPKLYLGNLLTSYGGLLNYDIFYTIGKEGTAVSGADIILQSGNMYLFYSNVEQPAAKILYPGSLDIVEKHFTLFNGEKATRENIMLVLNNLSGLYIRATYWNDTISTYLSVSMEAATAKFVHNSPIAYSVEHCQCPAAYQGLSCEECAPGYYRIDQGPHGGYCVPCECNGHSNECDLYTGICFNCEHHTAGDHCELCQEGFHGNATAGTRMDCLICACPSPTTSNNFATSCDVSPDGNSIHCECKQGYTGARCESCSTGFYGQPEEQNDFCRPCECSGNINPEQMGSCDSVTGECLLCLNNTFGAACSLCKPGYYGDAVNLRNCQSCDCHKTGTKECDHQTGICMCHPNVVGEKCDRCIEDHYGFESGRGCTACDCAVASRSTQCDDPSGQCACQDGVTGRRCDRCTSGYWNYTENGCLSCGCHSGFSVGVGCNVMTGQCECLPGVQGEKCDHCPHRWVLIGGEGCFECDSCAHDLLDVTDQMRADLGVVINEINTTATAFFIVQRLVYINETVDALHPEVTRLNPDLVDLASLEQELDRLDQDTKNLYKKTEYANENANGSIPQADKVRLGILNVHSAVQVALEDSYKTVEKIRQIADSLQSGDSVKSEQAIQEAEKILQEINDVNFDEYREEALNQKKFAEELVTKMYEFSVPTNKQGRTLDILWGKITDFDSRLDDITNRSIVLKQKGFEVGALNAENMASKVVSLANAANSGKENIETMLENSGILKKNATALQKDAEATYDTLGLAQLDLTKLKNDLTDKFNKESQDVTDIRKSLNEARDHAEILTQRGDQLEKLLNDSKITSDDALNAANAYRDIVVGIQDARQGAEDAQNSGINATFLMNGLGNRTSQSEAKSNILLNEARDALNKVQTELIPQLKIASKKVDDIHKQNLVAEEELKKINAALEDRLTSKPLNADTEDVNIKSTHADNMARETLDILDTINDALPDELTKAKQLPKDLVDTEKDIAGSYDQLKNISEVIPDLSNLITEVSSSIKTNANSDIEQKINTLNQLIAEARDEANRIKVGMTFDRSTQLTLQNPERLSSLGTSTKVSTYFRTKNDNGFLLYLGNENGTNLRRTRSDDFMVLEIENGFPVLTIDLGNGPEKILGKKYVADDIWYQVIVERTGKNVQLTIREEKEPGNVIEHVVKETLQGKNSIFNLDQEQSQLFVGGYPQKFVPQLKNRDAAFEGEMEELVIGKQAVSLWNFVQATGTILGAGERNKLVNLTPSTGYRFCGKGYVILDLHPQIEPRRITISFRFKTTAEDGLLFLIGKDSSFLSLELRSGHVVFQYKLADGSLAMVEAANLQNDGVWHTVEAIRFDFEGVLNVDNLTYRVKAEGNHPVVSATDYMYFGGFPGKHNFKEVTNVHFDGCIDNVVIETVTVDLSYKSNAFDVIPGCPPKFAGIVSFAENSAGYLLYPNATTGLQFTISLTFKTLATEGLIFYTTNKLQNETLSLSLVNGNLVLKNKDNSVNTSGIKFDDGVLHVVTAIHDANALELLINDFDHFKTIQKLPARKLTYERIYFGGVPSSLSVPERTVASRVPFVGCIQDVTLNSVIVNFADTTEKSQYVLGSCSATIPELSPPTEYHPVQKQPKIKEKIPTTTTETSTIPLDVHNEIEVAKVTPIPTQPTESCALPLDPPTIEGFDRGYQFGTATVSRVEYEELPSLVDNYMEFELEFRTNAPSGVLFYAADVNHTYFVSLFLDKGKLNFKFYAGSGPPAVLIHETRSNNNEWHHVVFKIAYSDGELIVDGLLVAKSTSLGTLRMSALMPKYYLGGTEPTPDNEVQTNLGISKTFVGCIRNFKYNSHDVGEPSKIVGVIPCSDQTEEGVFFNKADGYIKIQEQFRVGQRMEILMKIKPRHHTGLLLAVLGRKDYLILALKDGIIKLTVDNGKGPFEASFTPNSKHYICDGNWHSILALKSKNVASLAVDKVFSAVAQGESPITKTKNGLFVGGHPHLHKLKTFNVNETYVGCMKDLLINNKHVSLSDKAVYGNVTLNLCPKN